MTTRDCTSEAATRSSWPLDAKIGFAVVAAALIVILAVRSRTHVADAGDYFTDMDILMSGENFARQGFLALHFLPVHFIGDVSDRCGYYTYYTHYPPLPNVLNGVMRDLGITSLTVMRLFCGGLFVVGMLAMTLGVARCVGPRIAVCSLAVLATTGYYVAYCTSLQHALSFGLLGLFIYGLIRAVDAPRRAWLWWGVCWLDAFAASLTSYEFILYVQAFAWMYVIVARRFRKNVYALLILGTAPVLGVGLHFLQVVWAMGWEEALRDNLGFRHIRGGLGSERWENLARLPAHLWTMSRYYFFWPWPVYFLTGIAAVVVIGRRNVRARALGTGVLVASVMWYLAMPFHAAHHNHVVGQFLPLAMLGLGSALALCLGMIVGRGMGVARRVVGVLLVGGIAAGQVVRMAPQFVPYQPFLATIGELIGPDAFPPRAGVVSNAGFAQLAYFLRRPYWFLPNKEALPPVRFPDDLPRLQSHLAPGWNIEYYMLANWGDISAYDLLIKTCPGKQLIIPGARPSVIVFDIRELLCPADQRRPLDPVILRHQLRGEFPLWEPPGFRERWRKLLATHVRESGGPKSP